MISEQEAKSLFQEFLNILEEEEESDGGVVFKPVQIHSCRVMKTLRIDKIFEELKCWINQKEK